MSIEGKITLNAEKGTITIKLDDGSYCIDHLPNGVKNFLKDHIDYSRKGDKNVSI